MSRFIATLSAVLLPGVLAAQAPGGLRIVEAKVEKDQLQWIETVAVPVQKEVEVVVLVNGKQVREKRTVVVYETVQKTAAAALKQVKVTDAAGKTIAADKLADLLKEPTPVVVGPVSEKHRALFKDKTLFVELPALSSAKGPLVPQPVPAPIPPVKIGTPAPAIAPNLFGD